MIAWRRIDEFPEYVISEEGVVKHTRTNHITSVRQNQQGLVMVNLWSDSHIYTRLLARLVAGIFVRTDRPDHNSIIHLNGDRTDCRSINLMWRTRSYGLRYHRMFEETPYRVGVHVPALNRDFYSLREFCTLYGIVENDAYTAMINKEPCFHYGWDLLRLDND